MGNTNHKLTKSIGTWEVMVAGVALVVAALAAGFGALVQRWLFFAEAKHMVTLYYDRDAA